MSAFQQIWKSVTGVPAASMADKRYTFVNYNADGKIVTPEAGAPAIGVLAEPNGAGEPAQVYAQGFSFIKLGEDLQAGTQVQVGEGGTAVAVAEDGVPVGILAVGGSAGDLGTILLK